jgi:magnesium transporter
MSRKSRKHRMHDLTFSRRSLPGSAPGTLIVGPNAPKPAIRIIACDSRRIIEKDIEDVQMVRTFLGQWPVTWINVTGLGDLSVITKLGEIFNIHRLALEDVINVHQRPKAEQYKNYCFIVIRAVLLKEGYASEQVSIFRIKGWLGASGKKDGS